MDLIEPVLQWVSAVDLADGLGHECFMTAADSVLQFALERSRVLFCVLCFSVGVGSVSSCLFCVLCCGWGLRAPCLVCLLCLVRCLFLWGGLSVWGSRCWGSTMQ